MPNLLKTPQSLYTQDLYSIFGVLKWQDLNPRNINKQSITL